MTRWATAITAGRVRLTDIAYIETKTTPARLQYLRGRWDPTRRPWPIHLREDAAGVLSIRNGNHRLQLARERGDETIAAMFDVWETELMTEIRALACELRLTVPSVTYQCRRQGIETHGDCRRARPGGRWWPTWPTETRGASATTTATGSWPGPDDPAACYPVREKAPPARCRDATDSQGATGVEPPKT